MLAWELIETTRDTDPYPTAQGTESGRAGIDDSGLVPRGAGQTRSNQRNANAMPSAAPRVGAEYAPIPNQKSEKGLRQSQSREANPALNDVGVGSGRAFPVAQGKDSLGSDFTNQNVDSTGSHGRELQPGPDAEKSLQIGLPLFGLGASTCSASTRAENSRMEDSLPDQGEPLAGKASFAMGTLADSESGDAGEERRCDSSSLTDAHSGSPDTMSGRGVGTDRAENEPTLAPRIEAANRKAQQLLRGIRGIPTRVVEDAIRLTWSERASDANAGWLDDVFPDLFLRNLVRDPALPKGPRHRIYEHQWGGPVVKVIPPTHAPDDAHSVSTDGGPGAERGNTMKRDRCDAFHRLAVANPVLHDELLKEAGKLKGELWLADCVDGAVEEVCRTALRKLEVGEQISNPGGYLRRTAERLKKAGARPGGARRSSADASSHSPAGVQA